MFRLIASSMLSVDMRIFNFHMLLIVDLVVSCGKCWWHSVPCRARLRRTA